MEHLTRRIYLAARYDRQAELRGYREQLMGAGHVVTSRWLDGLAPGAPACRCENSTAAAR